MGAMLTRSQNHPVDRVLIQLQQARGGSHANPLGREVDNLSNGLNREMQAKQSTGMGGGKAFAAGAAVKQGAILILAVLAANGDVALAAQAIIFALFIGTETLLNLTHGLPPTKMENWIRLRQSYCKWKSMSTIW